MKKVLIISYYWVPEKGVGHKRWLGFIEYFKSNGYEPIIFTKGNTNSVSKVENSYTLIRKKIIGGKIQEANKLLNRESTVDGKVIKGKKRGRKIGFPTCNIN